MPMFKKSLIVLFILVLAAAGGTMYGYYSNEDTIPLDAGTELQTETLRTVTVYVTGEVKKPGLVTLTEGQRVADAVNAAGGVIETADIDHINMAAFLEDGAQIRVPLRRDSADSPAMSARIVEYRETNGDFQQLEDIKKVRGIGPAKFEKLKDKATI